MTETVSDLLAAHRAGLPPAETIAQTYRRIRAHADPALFLALRPEAEAIAAAEALAARVDRDRLPLYGVPFAVKDNLDVAGLPTTAACPAYAYTPTRHATVVARLVAAGAIPIGKTNLDQFATGLVGVRSPYGVPRNAVDPALIPGGSSAGSATAVAAGLVPFALGTDTAGSGRVPAALNRIVGLKPSLGALSTRGLVPACRTLDCVSVFALTVDDAYAVFAAAAGFDADDPFSRPLIVGPVPALPPASRIGVPRAADRLFFGDHQAEAAYDAALRHLEALGATLVEIDLTPFLDTARLLYDGPWVAERTHAVRDLLARDPGALHPVTRAIVEGGLARTAVDAFDGFYRLAALRRAAEPILCAVEALALPTIPTLYTVDEVLADPVATNARLGTYTNFVNLLDLCALAVPGPDRADARPAGVTLIAPRGQDARLAALGRALHAAADVPLGASARRAASVPLAAAPAPRETIEIVVVGAHMSGLPLNGELVSRGGAFVRTVETTADYRFYALPGGPPARPGLVRVAAGTGAAIAAEVWSLSPAAFGSFVASIPAPLGIGTVRLADGTAPKGFLCEAEGVRGATDITATGGWRAFLASRAA